MYATVCQLYPPELRCRRGLTIRLMRESKSNERIQREGRVADPRSPVATASCINMDEGFRDDNGDDPDQRLVVETILSRPTILAAHDPKVLSNLRAWTLPSRQRCLALAGPTAREHTLTGLLPRLAHFLDQSQDTGG